MMVSRAAGFTFRNVQSCGFPRPAASTLFSRARPAMHAARVAAVPRWLSSSSLPEPGSRETQGHVEKAAPADVAQKPMSFIDHVKTAGANALLGMFTNTGDRFDRSLKSLKVTRVGDGEVECELPVDKGVQNTYGTLHGGATATIIDVVGTMALLSVAPTKPGVSVELNTSFCSAAKAGDTVVIIGRVLKAGNKLGFTEVEIRRKSDNALVATGRHTKAL